MNRKASIVAAALLAPVLLLGGGVLLTRAGDGGAPTSAAAPTVPATEVLDSGADLSASIDALQRRLERLPEDEAAWSALGFAYVAQARRTADPSYYDKADEALARSLELEPEANADALAGQAALANARHDFADGRDLALAAVEADAYDSTARGVLADAQLELGDLDSALDTLDAMLRLRPGVPSFTRVAYTYELRGDVDNARYSLERALDISSNPGDASYVLLQLGDLAWSQGDYAAADEHYADGLRRDPGPGGAAGLAGTLGRVAGTRRRGGRGLRRRRRAAAAAELPGGVRRAPRQPRPQRRGGRAVRRRRRGRGALRGVRIGPGRRDGALPGRSRPAGRGARDGAGAVRLPTQPAGARRDGVGAARERSRRRGARARRAGRGRRDAERHLGLPPRHDPARARGHRRPRARRWSRPSPPTPPSRPCTRRSPAPPSTVWRRDEARGSGVSPRPASPWRRCSRCRPGPRRPTRSATSPSATTTRWC